MGNNVKPDGFAQWTALSNSYDVSLLYVECWRAVDRDILMPLFKTPVFGNVVKVVSPDNNGILHLSGNNKTLQNTSADGNISSERTLLINKSSLNCGLRSLDSKSNRANITHWFLALVADCSLTSNEDGILALISLFVLWMTKIRKRNVSIFRYFSNDTSKLSRVWKITYDRTLYIP